MKKTRKIAIANEKGGVGKTSTVINLGAALSLNDKKVLVVDMDPQFNATKGLGVELNEDSKTVYDLLKNTGKLSIKDAIVKTKWNGVDVIPSDVDLSGAEIELVDEPGREDRLKDTLSGLNGEYDFILFDTPPSLSLLTINVFSAANEVLIPCQTHPYAFEALEELFDTLSAVKEEINPDLNITGIVATFFDARTKVSTDILSHLKNHELYQNYIFETVIRNNTTIAASAAVRKPILYYRSTSFGSVDYKSLAQEVLAKKAGKLK